MNRFTKKENDGYSVSNQNENVLDAAINRLGYLEDTIEQLQQEVESMTSKMELLKTKGKERSVEFRQLLGQRYTYKEFIKLLNQGDE